jgi:hypothetical protein
MKRSASLAFYRLLSAGLEIDVLFCPATKPIVALTIITRHERLQTGHQTMSAQMLLTEEFDRYAAECRRLAKLAQRPSTALGPIQARLASERFVRAAAGVLMRYFSFTEFPRHWAPR